MADRFEKTSLGTVKKIVGILLMLFLISLLSVALVSAGWFGDFWSKILGKNIVSKATNTLNKETPPCELANGTIVFCRDTQECINQRCTLKKQTKKIGVIYAYESQNTYNPSWKEAIILNFSKAHDALLKLSHNKLNYTFEVLGEIQTSEFCWNPAKIGLNYIVRVSEINIANNQLLLEEDITTKMPLPGSDFGGKEILINSTKQIINVNGESHLKTETLKNINLDCPHCQTSSKDRTAEFQQLFPNENFQEVKTTYISINCSNNIVDNKFNTALLDSLKSRAAQTLNFNLGDYDDIIIVFSKLGTILPQESELNLNYRCTTSVGFTLAYSSGVYAENGLLQGGFINCPSSSGRFFDKTGWHIMVHEFLHPFGAVDIYDTGTIFGYDSPVYHRTKALEIDPLADESVMGDEHRSCKNISQQTGINHCNVTELERVYLDKYNQNLIGI